MNKVNSLYKFLKKKGHLFEAELLQRIIKKADSVDFILRKKAEEDSDKMELILSEDEFYDYPKQSEFNIKYIGYENLWDRTELKFAINGEEIKFLADAVMILAYPGPEMSSLADRLANFVGLKADLAYEYRGSIQWQDVETRRERSKYQEIISEKLLPYLQNIKRFHSDIIKAKEEQDGWDPY